MSRELTEKETQVRFLDVVCQSVRWWSKSNTSRDEALQGVAFSILVLLDGGGALPGSKVILDPHPDDKDYLKSQGDDWFPTDTDIAGDIHSMFNKVYDGTLTLESVRESSQNETPEDRVVLDHSTF